LRRSELTHSCSVLEEGDVVRIVESEKREAVWEETVLC
jgi:hypothetical protein